eukprot:TRINITY_DN215_c0_g5_i1.p5 TRINITY_DN215_c0_g5~~TRINITY_DN215_c0_g5_i1.p5  ORF type:complete len:407 (-),score=54.03 TRINITY_DN215_c0_g5_i1:11706-12926(-)
MTADYTVVAHMKVRLCQPEEEALSDGELQVNTDSSQFKRVKNVLERAVSDPTLGKDELNPTLVRGLDAIPARGNLHWFRVECARVVVDDVPNNRDDRTPVIRRPLKIHTHAYYLRSRSLRWAGATVTYLPCLHLEGSWEALCLPVGLKSKLMSYVRVRSILGANVGCSGLVLLYGPPGTGKTSLAHALAHESAVRGGGKVALVHVHTELLLSKYFAESSRNLAEMFDQVLRLARDISLVFVVIDELESIALTRSNHASGSEPGDAVRVVNSLLQCMDRITACGNIIVIGTTNLRDRLDEALVDRCDLLVKLDEPQGVARAALVVSAVDELVRLGLVRDGSFEAREKGLQALAEAVQRCSLLSGRRLRKVAVAALTETGISLGEDGGGTLSFERVIAGAVRALEWSG